jgi:hypothetical protein
VSYDRDLRVIWLFNLLYDFFSSDSYILIFLQIYFLYKFINVASNSKVANKNETNGTIKKIYTVNNHSAVKELTEK